MNDDYESRAKTLNLATPDEVKAALQDPSTYVLDIRTDKEVAAGHVAHPRWRQCNGTVDSNPDLEERAAEIVPDKDATIVLYCGIGRRAGTAKDILIAKGYHGKLLNAGGYDDILRMEALTT
jgi:phage shock protein E